jgi:hypothetical protein
MIQAGRHSCAIAISGCFEGGREIFSRDKALREAASRTIGSDPAAEAGTFCELEQERT